MYIEYNLRGALNAFFRRKLIIFFFFTLVVALGGLYILNIKDIYASSASLLVKFGQGAIPDFDRSGGSISAPLDRKEIIQSYAKILSSRDLLGSVFSKIGPEILYPPEPKKGIEKDKIQENPVQKAVRLLVEHDLSISADPLSNIIDISVKNRDPVIAAQFLEHLIERFIVYQNDLYGAPETRFLDEQLETAKSGLDRAKQELLVLKQANNISDLDKEIEILLSEKSDLSALAFSALSNAQEELDLLKTKEAEMEATYNDGSPFLASIQNQITVMENSIAARRKELISGKYNSGTLASKVAQIDARLAALEELRPSYDILVQKVKTAEKDYDYYKQRREDARISQMLRQQNITRISVIDYPLVAAQPLPARKKIFLAAFMLLGLCFGFGMALLLELVDDRITGPEDITGATGLPVLVSFKSGEIPYHFIKKSLFVRSKRKLESLFEELTLRNSGKKARKVIQVININKDVTNRMPLVFEMACSAAKIKNKKILIIDTIKSGNAFLQFDNVVHDNFFPPYYNVENYNFSCMPLWQEENHGFLQPENIKPILDECRKVFDFIIINSASPLHYPENLNISACVDGVAFVIEAEKTRIPVLQQIKQRLEHDGITVIGAVLNNQRHYIPKFLYSLLFRV